MNAARLVREKTVRKRSVPPAKIDSIEQASPPDVPLGRLRLRHTRGLLLKRALKSVRRA